MTLTATTAQQLPTPTIDGGSRTLAASVSMSSAQLTTTGVDISQTNLIAIQCVKFGAVVSETLTLQLSMDGGSNYRDYKTYTFAQVSVTNGAYFVETVKGTHARLLLGNAQASIGLTVRTFV